MPAKQAAGPGAFLHLIAILTYALCTCMNGIGICRWSIRKDTIEIMDGDLDITGWDLKKALILLKEIKCPVDRKV